MIANWVESQPGIHLLTTQKLDASDGDAENKEWIMSKKKNRRCG